MPWSDAVREVGHNAIDAHVPHAPNVLQLIDGVGEDLSPKVVVGLKQYGGDGRIVEPDVGSIQGDDLGDGISREVTMVQDHEMCLRFGLPHAMQFFRQERRVNEPAGKTDAFHDRAGLVSDSLDLQFENDADGVSGDIQSFFQCGDALPIARVEPLNLLQRHLGESAGFVGRAIDGLIVQQHEMAVAGFAQVDFDEICVKRSSFPNSGESIFGSVAGGSAMTDAKDGSDSDLA